jgi:hypothetical protein
LHTSERIIFFGQLLADRGGGERREGTMVVVVGVIDEEFMVELVAEKK